MESYTEVFSWGSDQAGQLGLGGTIGKTYSVPRLCSFNVLIRELSCGEEHTAFISSSYHVYTMGSNTEGRLGIDDRSVTFSSSPCLVSHLTDKHPVKIACGWGHTAVITESGEVYTWGVGEFGALGAGSASSQWFPHNVRLPEGAFPSQVSCGSRHSAILSKAGQVLVSGCGKAGQLGTRRRDQENSFILLDLKSVVSVSCGVFHTAVLNSKGQVLTSGGNSFGQLGLGNKKSTSAFEQVKGLDAVFISKIACGYHSAAVCDKGEIYVWGSGSFGEFLIPHKMFLPARVRDLAVGGTFAVAILQDLTVFAWGNNANGELGLGDLAARGAPALVQSLKGRKINSVACGGNFCIALGNDIVGKNGVRRTGHVRSHSKVEKSTTENTFSQKPFEFFKLEEKVTDEKLRNERLRFDLDETTSQNIRLKNKSSSLEHGLKSIEIENQRLKDENSSLLSRIQDLQKQHKDEANQLLIRIQEVSKQSKEENSSNVFRLQDLNNKLRDEVSQLKHENQDLQKQIVDFHHIQEENCQLSRRLSELKHFREENSQISIRLQESQHHIKDQQMESIRLREETQQLSLKLLETQSQLKEIDLIREENIRMKRNIEDFEKFYKDLETSKKELNDERMKNKAIEKNFFVLTEENSKLLKQSENLFTEISRVQKENEHSILIEKENNYSAIRSKELEIEKISQSYHELLVQINRLAEENKIYRANNLELEEKNRRLFENLEKELAARAHDYKERTLTMLNTPVPDRENFRPMSPMRNSSVSPIRVSSKTDANARTKLSEVTQAKIGNTAARLLAKMENESALANIRISSPSRRSPDRPVPYKSGVSREIRDILRSKLQEYRE